MNLFLLAIFAILLFRLTQSIIKFFLYKYTIISLRKFTSEKNLLLKIKDNSLYFSIYLYLVVTLFGYTENLLFSYLFLLSAFLFVFLSNFSLNRN